MFYVFQKCLFQESLWWKIGFSSEAVTEHFYVGFLLWDIVLKVRVDDITTWLSGTVRKCNNDVFWKSVKCVNKMDLRTSLTVVLYTCFLFVGPFVVCETVAIKCSVEMIHFVRISEKLLLINSSLSNIDIFNRFFIFFDLLWVTVFHVKFTLPYLDIRSKWRQSNFVFFLH